MFEELKLCHNFPYKQYLLESMCRLSMPSIKFGSAPKWLKLANKSAPAISHLKNKFKNETIICVGNGPSILNTDIIKLNGKLVIGVNMAYQLLRQINPKEFFLVVQDAQRFDVIKNDLDCGNYNLFVSNCHFHYGVGPPIWLNPITRNHYVFMPYAGWVWKDNAFYFESDFSTGFSDSPQKYLYCGYSVIFSAIQIAAFMGAKKIVCIGIDMDYSGPVSFFPGVKNIWPDFDYELHAKDMFIFLRDYLKAKGVDLINSTPQGKVDVLDRKPLADIL